ncbi:MAG: 16S rRNA (guanine(966)-N(2))-methyltransferase RsmD [Ruminococcus sp.]|jgi:16S rRNA (guanine(966)-N(2))-methyltransferase RsmD|nr:16S rRNA (guanine(966)-N(2))-methyltransferase RsmD [Ruminococcus sp.]
MRVITGEARGRNLITLEGEDVRPTTSKIKEAVFSMIQFDIQGRTFLDLFAGSGQMGIEALSRGAESAVFVDSSRKAVEVVRKNLNNTGLYNRAKVLHTDSISYIDMISEPFDIVYLDPPYGTGLLEKAMEKICSKIKKTGIIIAENSEKEEILRDFGEFTLDRQKHYGKIKISMYRHSDFVQE